MPASPVWAAGESGRSLLPVVCQSACFASSSPTDIGLSAGFEDVVSRVSNTSLCSASLLLAAVRRPFSGASN